MGLDDELGAGLGSIRILAGVARADAVPVVERRPAARSRAMVDGWSASKMMDVDSTPYLLASKRCFPGCGVTVLTVYADPPTILRAVCAGVDGYLYEHTGRAEIIEHLEMVRRGGAPLTPGMAAALLDVARPQLKAPPPADAMLELSARARSARGPR